MQSHEAALALVKADVTASQSENSKLPATSDPDLQRADELVSLHYDVKVKYLGSGPDPELVQAGRDVDKVLGALKR